MRQSNSIFLVGPMGSGKTTVGKYIADFLSLCFYDSDTEIEKNSGASISWIFDKEGEAGFRRREEKAVDFLTKQEGIVLATGGGAVISALNREHLKNRGQVVYLSASVDVLMKRTRKDKSRPLLQTANPKAVIKKLLVEREAYYRDVADIVIQTKDGSAKEMAKKVIEQLEQNI